MMPSEDVIPGGFRSDNSHLMFDDLMHCPKSNSPSTSTSVPPVLNSDDDSICAELDRWVSSSIDESASQLNSDRVRELEEEQQRLSESILSLSTHFAHIQFRIQQISNAPPDQREEMLKELQDFASRGCIDINEVKQETKVIQETQQNGRNLDDNIQQKRARVMELIKHLRKQLEDLEKFAYENGEGELPMSELRQRQKVVFEKLQEKIQLKIELDKQSEEELQKNVDEGLNQLLNPIKEKEKVIDQLQTQIVDLERFVGFLQQENQPVEFDEKPSKTMNIQSLESINKPLKRQTSIFGLLGQSKFEKNALKSTPRGNHYGDQRAQLELAVDKVIQVLEKYKILPVEPEERDEEAPLPTEVQNETIFAKSEEEIVAVIRKTFCPALKVLLEHGMREYIPNDSTLANLAMFGCFSHRNKGHSPVNGRPLEHIWDVITYFYECRKASELSDATIGSLSQSFKLDSIDGKSITSKQLLLSTIENVEQSHRRLKRSPDSMWKAFVCAALNERKLPGWIRMIFRSEPVVGKCYNRWSLRRHPSADRAFT